MTPPFRRTAPLLAGLSLLVSGCGLPATGVMGTVLHPFGDSPAPEQEAAESWTREDWIMTCVDAEQHEGYAPLTRLTLRYPDGRTRTVFEMENGELLPGRVGTNVTCSYAPAPPDRRPGAASDPPRQPAPHARRTPG